jgi:hypothetical protein
VYLSGASFHPAEGFELKTSTPRQKFVSNWLILTSQSRHEISISQSRNDSEKKAVRRDRTRPTHTWKQLSSSTGEFSCTLAKINCYSYTCHSRLQKSTDLLLVLIFSYFRSLQMNIWQGTCLRPDTSNMS